jgi:hypothetical protein
VSVPAPSITPTLVPGSTNNLLYAGNVGAAGVNTDLNISLMGFPEHIRLDPQFRDQLLVTFKSLDANLSFAGPNVLVDADFVPVPGTDPQPNEYVQIQVTSDLVTRQCMILLEHRHTYTR